jgi:hypothetical protein
MAAEKKDRRSENGGIDQGLTKAKYLINTPEVLMAGMKALAKSRGQSLAYVWRAAGDAYLAAETKKSSKKS